MVRVLQKFLIMAVIITEPIGSQGFEKVNNRIAEILLEEITNQKNLQGFDETLEIYSEVLNPFDKSMDVMISVSLKQMDYSEFTARDSQGNTLYYIDLFVSGMGIGDVEARDVVKNKLYRYLGLIKYILSSSKYLTLGFAPGFIGGKYVHKIIVDDDYSNHERHSNWDTANVRFARVFFGVRIQENQLLWDSIPLQGNNTNITYDNTGNGTQLIFNN